MSGANCILNVYDGFGPSHLGAWAPGRLGAWAGSLDPERKFAKRTNKVGKAVTHAAGSYERSALISRLPPT